MYIQQRRLKGWRRLALMPLLLLAVLMLILTGSLGLRSTAHAQSVNSISVASTGKLTLARTAVLISATVTCTVPEGFTFQNAFGGVGITQVSGHLVTQGFGSFNLTTCDGTAQTFQVLVAPNAGLPSFHGGPASATGELFVNYLDASGNSVQEQTVTSPQVIRIKG
jgi:hypothetical protein